MCKIDARDNMMVKTDTFVFLLTIGNRDTTYDNRPIMLPRKPIMVYSHYKHLPYP